MHQLLSRVRRRGWDKLLCLRLLLLLLQQQSFVVVGEEISAAFPGGDSDVPSAHHSAATTSTERQREVAEIRQLGTWDALTLCIKDSKEERALERWLFCVEAVAARETSGIPLFGQESEAIKSKIEMSNADQELSILGNIKSREGFWRGRMDLDRPNDQLQVTEFSELGRYQLQTAQGGEDGSKEGGLGLFKVKDISGNEGTSSLDSTHERDSAGALPLVEQNGHRGFISGPPDGSPNPSPANDGTGDSECKSREDFLSYRTDRNEGSASDSSDEVDQEFADFKSREGRDDSKKVAEKDFPLANSLTTDELNSCSSGGLPSQEGLIEERENVSSSSEQQPLSSLGMRDAITSAAVVGLLTWMLKAQRGKGAREIENQPEISTGRSKVAVESKTLQIERNFFVDTAKLSQTLGMAVAQVFFEVLEQNGDYIEGSLSAESLSNLLESALKESLIPVLGNELSHFVEEFRDSFSCTYKTRESVRSAYIRGIGQTQARNVSGKSWRGSQPKLRRESQREHYSDNVVRRVDDQEVDKRLMKKLGAAHRKKAIPVEDKFSDSDLGQGTTFFSSTNDHEQDERNYYGESGAEHCLGRDSLSETSQLGFHSQEINIPLGDEEDCSQDEQMYSADDSSGSEEWIVLEGRGSGSEAVGPKDSVSDDGPSSYHSLECDQGPKDENYITRDLVHVSQNPQRSSSSAGGVGGSSVDYAHWKVGSSSSPGIATPRSELSDQTLEGGTHWDFTRLARLKDDMEEPFLRGLIADSLLQSGKLQIQSLTPSEYSGTGSLLTSEHNVDVHGRRGRGEERLLRRSVSAENGGKSYRTTTPEHNVNVQGRRDRSEERLFRRSVSAENDGKSDRTKPRAPPQSRADGAQRSEPSVQDALVVARSSNVVGFKAALVERYDLLERSVAAQEQHNRLMAWDLQRRSQGLAIKQEHLHLQFESNSLMKENVELTRVKAEFKENELQDRKLNLAYREFSRTCADHLVAGLCVMLVVLSFSFWKFSYDRLSGVITVCKPPARESHHQTGWLGTNWMYNSLNAFTYQVQAFTCEITKAGRMLVGLVIIAFVTTSLLRQSVTSSGQAMPATIIVIVLGGICGFAGKVSIDSLGGSGLHWLVLWECLCFLHVFATCFTPLLYRLLNGPPARNFFEEPSLASRISSGVSRFMFHTVLAFILPLMAGLLPFASPEEILQIFLDWWSPGTFHGKYRVHF